MHSEFRQVGDAIRSHPILSKIPLIGLTATATPRVRTDILDSLRLRDPFVSQLSLDRANLKIEVYRKKGIPDAMKEFLISASGPLVSTIIYAPTRATVESIHQYLVSHGVSCEAYHAGLADRANAHTNFLTGKTTVLVATTAFGMVTCCNPGCLLAALFRLVQWPLS
jgi:superfamily II DNA helicase RecQ